MTRLQSIVTAVATAVALVLVLVSIDFAKLASSFRQLAAGPVALATMLLVGNVLFAYLRFEWTLGALGVTLERRALAYAFALGNLASQFLLNIIGQSLTRAVVLQGSGVAMSATVAATYIERLIALATVGIGALVSALLNAPLIFPGVVVGVALLQGYALVHMNGTLVGLALAHMVITVPYVIRAVMASLEGIDPEIERAARVLGASGPVAFFTVTLPLIRPGVAAGALFSFIVSFDNVPVSIFLLGAGQMTLPVKIFTAIEYGVDPSVAAISTMLIALTGLGLAAAERWVGFHRFV